MAEGETLKLTDFRKEEEPKDSDLKKFGEKIRKLAPQSFLKNRINLLVKKLDQETGGEFSMSTRSSDRFVPIDLGEEYYWNPFLVRHLGYGSDADQVALRAIRDALSVTDKSGIKEGANSFYAYASDLVYCYELDLALKDLKRTKLEVQREKLRKLNQRGE